MDDMLFSVAVACQLALGVIAVRRYNRGDYDGYILPAIATVVIMVVGVAIVYLGAIGVL